MPIASMVKDAQASAPKPAPAPVATSNDNTAVYGALGAGGALLALGIGAAALARKSKRADDEVVREPPVTTRPVDIEPVIQPVDAPVGLASATATEIGADRAPAAARFPSVEAMVAAPPSAENPFLTRKKRMRRAKYIMEHGAPEPLSEPARAEASVQQPQFKPQPAYEFSKTRPPRQSWKPVTS